MQVRTAQADWEICSYFWRAFCAAPVTSNKRLITPLPIIGMSIFGKIAIFDEHLRRMMSIFEDCSPALHRNPKDDHGVYGRGAHRFHAHPSKPTLTDFSLSSSLARRIVAQGMQALFRLLRNLLDGRAVAADQSREELLGFLKGRRNLFALARGHRLRCGDGDAALPPTRCARS